MSEILLTLDEEGIVTQATGPKGEPLETGPESMTPSLVGSVLVIYDHEGNQQRCWRSTQVKVAFNEEGKIAQVADMQSGDSGISLEYHQGSVGTSCCWRTIAGVPECKRVYCS